MLHTLTLFAAEEGATGLGALGVSLQAFFIQLVTFVFVFLVLKRFAVGPIIALLEKRRKTIDDGVKMGLKLEKEREKLDKEIAQAMRDARHEADRIIANSHKEAREILREAEKSAQRKTDAMLTDAQARIEEESRQAKRSLEKDIVGLVSEATETIVGEKVDAKKDAALIDKALKGRRK
jgi:F-type H+-transporting ATPase subunit b